MSSATIKVPFGQKVAFGIGMLANQMFPAIRNIHGVISTIIWIQWMDVVSCLFFSQSI